MTEASDAGCFVDHGVCGPMGHGPDRFGLLHGGGVSCREAGLAVGLGFWSVAVGESTGVDA